MKICFLGAGSTVFAKNILGDCIVSGVFGDFEIALHDIDAKRLNESYNIISAINSKYGDKATVTKHLNRREALTGSTFIVNAIQVGGYKPSTVTDFAVPRRYMLHQTIADTLGVGGIMRALRTIPVLAEFAKDIEEVCPDAYFLNYSNPMAMLIGYLLKYTKVKAVGLCHSVQACVPELFKKLKIDIDPKETKWDIYGINHMAWLLKLEDQKGNDLYPLVKEKAKKPPTLYGKADKVRFKLMDFFGYYVTESSEHNAEYNPWFIKKWNFFYLAKNLIPLNEYPRRCRWQILNWKWASKKLSAEHTRTHEYGSYIMEAIYTGKPYQFHGSVLNSDSLIENLPKEAIVEVPIIADKNGFTALKCGSLPDQLAALNITNITPQLLTLKANETRRFDDIVTAVAFDPHTAAVLNLDQIRKMTRQLYKRHRKEGFMPEYK